jgi:hypothetical protein
MVRKGIEGSRRRTVRLLVCCALVVLGVMGASVSTASARTSSGSTYSGTASLQKVQASFVNGGWQLKAGGGTAYEAPRYANWDQYVCATTELVSWNNTYGWVHDSSYKACGWILAGSTSLNLPTIQFGPLARIYGGTIYSFNVQLTWQFSNGNQIGSRMYDFNSGTDYNCGTVCAVSYPSVNTSYGVGVWYAAA